MEFLKSNLIINESYKPSLEMAYMDYFNRAMVFAQTNYSEQLDKVAKTQFKKLSPTNFLEEYAWCISCVGKDIREASILFPELSKQLSPYYRSFWDLNSFPVDESVNQKLISILQDEKKFYSIDRCASIVNQGIRLFGWEDYKNNFLNCPEKLMVLPGLGLTGAKLLSRNIGASQEIISTTRLYGLAMHWGFSDSLSLCRAIQKNVAMQLKIIELILWYAACTFSGNETNMLER